MPKKKLTGEECEDILKKAEVGYLSMCLGAQPYCLPFNFAYDSGGIYIHTGLKGLKWDYLNQNPSVCFTVTSIGDKKSGASPCQYAYEFDSVNVFGRVSEINSKSEIAEALANIIDKYKVGPVSPVPEEKLAVVRMLRIDVDKITGKQYR